MASLGKNTGPYELDAVKVMHKNAIVTTIVGSPVYDEIIKNMEDIYEYTVGYVPAGFENRPDLLSNVFYGTPKNWWLLMLVNNITDPFEGFKVNERILIPKIQ